ncbi:MAG: phasin family protein [Pseudolabrys sp.]
MKSTDLTEQWSVMQKMFLPTSAFSAPLQENARRFWENQEKVLDSMQALANGWFERRRTGTHSAREAAERMSGTETFADMIQAYQDWAGGAFERIMADGLSCQQQIMATTGALAAPPIAPSASEKEAEPARSESRAPTRSKTT